MGVVTTPLHTDDLLVAPDFFSYFHSLRPVLNSDPSVWCVSAWNDNGKKGFIDTTANGKQATPPHSETADYVLCKVHWLF